MIKCPRCGEDVSITTTVLDESMCLECLYDLAAMGRRAELSAESPMLYKFYTDGTGERVVAVR